MELTLPHVSKHHCKFVCSCECMISYRCYQARIQTDFEIHSREHNLCIVLCLEEKKEYLSGCLGHDLWNSKGVSNCISLPQVLCRLPSTYSSYQRLQNFAGICRSKKIGFSSCHEHSCGLNFVEVCMGAQKLKEKSEITKKWRRLTN